MMDKTDQHRFHSVRGAFGFKVVMIHKNSQETEDRQRIISNFR